MKLYHTLLQRSQLSSFNTLNFALKPKLTSQSLITIPHFGFRKARPRIQNTDYELELQEYKKKMGEMRLKHRKEYWEQQTQVENLYIERFRRERLEKQRRDLDRWRTAICNISMHTKKQIKDLEKREKDLLLKMRDADILDMRRKLENKMMLDVMTLDSKRWPNLLDMDQRIHEHIVIPQKILHYQEYQKKLQNLAFYAEQGDHESMQKLLDSQEVMEKKNLHLQPMFRDLKSIIKHMTYTEEYRLLKEYTDSRAMILSNTPLSSEQGKEGVAKLEKEYAKLLHNYKKSLQNPTKKLKTLQKRLEDMFQLLSLWTQYVEIIYMPETELHIIDTIRKIHARPEAASYSMMMEEKEMENRLNTLFGKEDEQSTPTNKDKDEYETVNEGMTTDTTEASGLHKRGVTEQDEIDEEKKAAKDHEDKKQAKGGKGNEAEEEGILSSDEEENTRKFKNKLDVQQTGKKEIKQFQKKGDKQKKGIDDQKDNLETKYNYADQDIEQYGAKILTKAEGARDRPQKGEDEDEDQERRYVSETQYNQQILEGFDMQGLNLFGVGVEGQEGGPDEVGKRQTQQALQDLIDMVDQQEGDDFQNFNIRKSFVYYDPYNPDESVADSYLKFEDNLKLRASIVLDHYKNEITAMKDETLNFADRERKQQVLKLIDQLSDIKVIDAQVLMRIYDLYRYKI